MFLEMGKYDRAIADLTAAIDTKEIDGHIYYCRALAYKAKGDEGKAVADFRRASALGFKAEPGKTPKPAVRALFTLPELP